MSRHRLRVACRYDWSRVTPPTPFGDTHSTAVRYYIANPTPELALNAWRQSGYWRWGILAFLAGMPMVFREGSAPTLNEAKLRAESALPDDVHPQARLPWDGTLPETPAHHDQTNAQRFTRDRAPNDLPF